MKAPWQQLQTQVSPEVVQTQVQGHCEVRFVSQHKVTRTEFERLRVDFNWSAPKFLVVGMPPAGVAATGWMSALFGVVLFLDMDRRAIRVKPPHRDSRQFSLIFSHTGNVVPKNALRRTLPKKFRVMNCLSGLSKDNLPKLDALIFNQLSERQGQAESEAEYYRERMQVQPRIRKPPQKVDGPCKAGRPAPSSKGRPLKR